MSLRFLFLLVSDSHSSELIIPAPCVESAHATALEMFPEGELTFLGVHVQ